VGRGKVVAHKVRGLLEIEPARHQTEVRLGVWWVDRACEEWKP